MPLSPSQTRTLLQQLDHHPRQPLGQNFLVDGNLVRKSLAMADIHEGDTVIEIGPGLGTLTSALLEADCKVYAIELDPILANYLKDTFNTRFPDSFHLLQGDAVRNPLAGLPPTAASSSKVVANLPYAITSPWLDGLLNRAFPKTIVLLLQKEAADRMVASPGTKAFGALSIFLSAAYQPTAQHRVPRNCFHPVPKVDSRLLRLDRRPHPVRFSKPARNLIRTLFTQRRKQIGTLLRPYPEIQFWLDDLPAFGCSATSRPEAIPLAAWSALANQTDLPQPPQRPH